MQTIYIHFLWPAYDTSACSGHANQHRQLRSMLLGLQMLSNQHMQHMRVCRALSRELAKDL